MRNYRKEYDNYHSRPEQKIIRAARNAARKLFADASPDKDVHHKDNNPLNNDKKNLSLVTQHYNRREPRLRKEDMGTVTGPHIVGTGDDSSTVVVKKKKKKKRDEAMRGDRKATDWEKRGRLSKKVRKDFWKSFKKKKEQKESSDKRILDNVLAIQQKI